MPSASESTASDKRPIAVIGGGTLGRRIALMISSQGGEVRLYIVFTPFQDVGLKIRVISSSILQT